MTLYEIVDILKKIALNQPNIRSASDGSVYDKMNTNPSVQYDVFHISQTNHQEDFETDYYGLQLFYISRLEDSLEDNRLQIQSIGKEILGNVIRTFCENFSIDYPTITYIPFTQKFNDLTAGVYCNVRLEVPKDLICADDYYAEVVPGSGLKLQDIGITITENGLRVITADAEYDGIGEVRIEVDVPQSAAVLQDKEVEYTENGSYSIHPDPAYDGLSSVSVDVDVPDNYDEGYDDGKEDGEREQKAKLAITSFTENNTYTRENGWSAVTVNVPATENRYDEGYADGMEAQKAKMVATAITENGAYGRPDGYSAVTVDVPSNYQDGYDDGVEDQKGKLTTLSVNENGIYTREDGWSAITVAVPQTGSSNEDLIANLQGDYYLIPYGTERLRDYAFYFTCFSSITIPDTVVAIGSYAFAYNECLTSITIPDSVQSVGKSAFYRCVNLQTAILGNGLSQLEFYTFQNCYSLTGITIPSGISQIGNFSFANCSGLTEMTFEGLTPPTINTENSLGSTAYTFPIYVPCQSLDAYKTAFGEYYAPRIQCREQEMITAITLNVSSAITDSGTATTTYSPSNAYVDYYYTSSNPSIATIDPNTGVITVVANGSVTICTIDRISGLQDCKEISVAKSAPYATSISINVPATITDSATATTTVTPSSAQTNLQYSSSDTSKATINATTGAISVIASGTVQFCVTDTLSGLQSCKNANVRKAATAITINVPSTVTDSATATTTVSPTGATTNLTYTSSNTSKATINSKTGAITVKENGSVTFCVRDSISNLQSCKTVNVVKTQPITAFTYTADTSLIAYTGENRTITYSTSGFNSSSIGLITSMNVGYSKNGNTFTLSFPYNYYGEQKTYYADLTGYTSAGTKITTRINYTQEANPNTGHFIVVYNVTSTTVPTQLYYPSSPGCTHSCSENTLSAATIYTQTGGTIPLSSESYTFPVSGRVPVIYYLKGEVIGKGNFFGCSSIIELSGFSGVKRINESAFKNCTALTGITISGVEDFGPMDDGRYEVGVFQGCSSLHNINLDGTATRLAPMMFADCGSLGAVNIPSSISHIEDFCFENCSGTTSMTFNSSTPPSLGGEALGDTSYTFPIYVPSNAVSTYKSDRYWSGYANRIQAKP